MIARIFLVSAFSMLLLGCPGGSDLDLNKVSGTVTLDGQPLAKARIIYTPEGGGRPGFGMTDEDGYYELAYTTTGEGTPPGEYVVAISTFIEPEEDADGNMTEVVPERVPVKYVKQSPLRATVPGGNYDFALEGGEIEQPTTETMREREAEEAGN